MPFDLAPDEFLDFALTQFQQRQAWLRRALAGEAGDP
jgi:hypothetical protein